MSSVLAFVGCAVSVAYTLQNEKFEKVSVQTDDPSTDGESHRDTNNEIENTIQSSKCRADDKLSPTRYTSIQ